MASPASGAFLHLSFGRGKGPREARARSESVCADAGAGKRALGFISFRFPLLHFP